MNPRPILVLFLSCLTISTLSAQGPDNNAPIDPAHIPGLPAAKEGDIMCRCISTFLLKKGEVFYFKIGKSFHMVDLVGEGFSQPFPVRGSTAFRLYKKTPADIKPADKDRPPYVPVIQQALKGDGNNFIIVLSRKDAKSPLKSKAFNINKTRFPANNIYLFNESPVALGLQVNTSQGVVQAYKHFNYSYSNTTRDTYTSAKIIMRYKGEKKIMASKRLRLVPGRRMILVCFPSKSRAKLGATPLRMVTYQDKP